MSRIAQLRESLASYVGGDGFRRTITRRAWAEYVRDCRLVVVPSHLSVRELQLEAQGWGISLNSRRPYWAR
jgi:hypothetical protein